MALALAAPAASHAQPGADEAELARLRSVFSDGIRLEEQSRWADALAAFEEVAKAKRTAAVVFHLGLCHEKLYKLKKAKATFEEAETLAAS